MTTNEVQRKYLPSINGARSRMGLYGIQSENLKALNKETVASINELMEHIWKGERIPQD